MLREELSVRWRDLRAYPKSHLVMGRSFNVAQRKQKAVARGRIRPVFVISTAINYLAAFNDRGCKQMSFY